MAEEQGSATHSLPAHTRCTCVVAHSIAYRLGTRTGRVYLSATSLMYPASRLRNARTPRSSGAGGIPEGVASEPAAAPPAFALALLLLLFEPVLLFCDEVEKYVRGALNVAVAAKKARALCSSPARCCCSDDDDAADNVCIALVEAL